MNLGTSRVGDVDYCRIDYFLRLGVEWTWSVACSSPLKDIDILIVAKSATNGACSASRNEEVGDHDLKWLELERR